MKLFDKMGEKYKEYKGKFEEKRLEFEAGREERRTKEVVSLKKRQELLREQVKTKRLENQLQAARKKGLEGEASFGPKINFSYSNPSLTEANPLKKKPKKPESVGFQGTNPYQLY